MHNDANTRTSDRQGSDRQLLVRDTDVQIVAEDASVIKQPDTPEFPQLMPDEEIDAHSKVVNQPNQRQPTDKELTDEAFATLKMLIPRIHKHVLALWGTPEGDAYLNGLLIDDRGNRQGFPPDVLRVLLILQRVHFRFSTFKKFDPRDTGWKK